MARRPQAEARRGSEAQGGKSFQWLGLVILLSLIMGGIAWGVLRLNDPSLLPIRVVKLQGELEHVDPEALKAVIMPFAQDGFLKIDVKAVRAAVEGMPWVNQATVRRKWPDVLELEVTERKVLARWNDQALLDEQGIIFEPERSEWPQGLADLQGPEGTTAAVAEGYREISTLFETLGLKVDVVEMTERRAWRIGFDEDRELLLGRTNFDGRLQRFARIYRAVLASQKQRIARIDMRYTNGFAVSWLEQPAGV